MCLCEILLYPEQLVKKETFYRCNVLPRIFFCKRTYDIMYIFLSPVEHLYVVTERHITGKILYSVLDVQVLLFRIEF